MNRARALVLHVRKRLGDRLLPTEDVGTRAGFDLWSAVYEREAQNPLSMLDEAVFRDLTHRAGMTGQRVLDYGCGLGRHWPALLTEQPSELVGADISPGMLQRATAAFPAHSFVCLPPEPSRHTAALVDAGRFDVVTTALVLHYVRDLPATFEAFRSVLAPGGRVALTLLHPGLGEHNPVSFRVGLSRYNLDVAPFGMVDLEQAWQDAGFERTHEVHGRVDESLREAFERLGGRDVYKKMVGKPLLYGAVLVAGS